MNPRQPAALAWRTTSSYLAAAAYYPLSSQGALRRVVSEHVPPVLHPLRLPARRTRAGGTDRGSTCGGAVARVRPRAVLVLPHPVSCTISILHDLVLLLVELARPLSRDQRRRPLQVVHRVPVLRGRPRQPIGLGPCGGGSHPTSTSPCRVACSSPLGGTGSPLTRRLGGRRLPLLRQVHALLGDRRRQPLRSPRWCNTLR